MVRDIKKYEYGLFEGKIDSLKWGKDISLICDTKEQFNYAEKCLSYFDSMPNEVELRLSKYLLRYFKEHEQYFDEEELKALGPINETNILNHIGIGSIIVDSNCRKDRIEFHIEGGCDWEIEHGLEITISDDKILYVGPFNDYGPNSSDLRYVLDKYGYYKPDSDGFNMNYVDEE